MKIQLTICIFLSLFTTLNGQNTLTSSNLPLVMVNTSGKTITKDAKISATMKIVYNGEGQRNAISDTVYHYNGYIGIRLRGNSSLNFDQKQYAVETRDATGENLNVPLLGMPKENDWLLYAPYNDISLIRNVYAYGLWGEMGHWGPRTKMVEVLLNGAYQGVYVLIEHIKRDKGRIDIAELDSTDTSGLDLTGGYIMKIDDAQSDDLSFVSKVPGLITSSGWGVPNTQIKWVHDYPTGEDILQVQANYIHNYIDTVEQLIQSAQFNNPVTGYSKYLDVPSFVDYLLHTELSLNADGYKKSAFFYKDKLATDGTGGKLHAGSVWDYNLAYGNCNFCNGNVTTAWVYKGCSTLPVPAFWKRLTQDPTFMNAVKSRYQELRSGILSQAHINAYVDEHASLLNEAQARHFAKWNKLLGGKDPMLTWFAAYNVSSYAQEIQTVKTWFATRLKFLDTNLGGLSSSTTQQSDISLFDVTVYQIPFSGLWVVESRVPLKRISIYNLIGKKIAVEEMDGTDKLVLTNLKNAPTGLYLLLMQSENGSCISKTILNN